VFTPVLRLGVEGYSIGGTGEKHDYPHFISAILFILASGKMRSIVREVNMGAVENVKEIAEMIGKFHDIELNRRILKLEEEVIDLTRDKRRAEDKVEELERALKFRGELIEKDGLIWLEGDPIAFCRACWDSKRHAIHLNRLTFPHDGKRFQCPICKEYYHPRQNV
jgi:hypothetical protein